MEFRQLVTFRRVAETLNFTRAAEQLNMAQSSVSAQIGNLEKELGIMLFDRIGRQVFLTDAGNTLLRYAAKIEGMTEEIHSQLKAKDFNQGRLIIRMPESLATTYMIDVIEEYNTAFPDVQLSFITCSDRQLGRELSSGRIDLAFLLSDTINLNDVNSRYLKTEELVLLASPDHPLVTSGEIDIEHLHNHLLLLPRTD